MLVQEFCLSGIRKCAVQRIDLSTGSTLLKLARLEQIIPSAACSENRKQDYFALNF